MFAARIAPRRQMEQLALYLQGAWAQRLSTPASRHRMEHFLLVYPPQPEDGGSAPWPYVAPQRPVGVPQPGQGSGTQRQFCPSHSVTSCPNCLRRGQGVARLTLMPPDEWPVEGTWSGVSGGGGGGGGMGTDLRPFFDKREAAASKRFQGSSLPPPPAPPPCPSTALDQAPLPGEIVIFCTVTFTVQNF